MEYQELTEKVIGCAYRVYNQMGFDFLESVYSKCMMIELKKAGLHAEAEKRIQVFYDEELVGDFIADIVVDGILIVELKSVRKIAKAHEVQLVNYLAATKKPVGLVLNFGERSVGIKRKLRQLSRPPAEFC